MTVRSHSLLVDDEEFLVTSLIDRCPKTMMLRELVQNAVEAARLSADGRGEVWIERVEIDSATKLAIRNTGPGMTPAMLRKMSDIAASIGKVKGLTENFGMGAKVASLPSNPLGVRYRSCAEGVVSEIIIGKYNGVYGRLARRDAAGEVVDVLDISADYAPQQRARDWTEVALLGSRAGQDTSRDPYGGDPIAPEYWLPETLYHRFFRLPTGVRIEIGTGLTWLDGPRRFETLAQRFAAFRRYEAAPAPSGVTIHYLHDPAHAERTWENDSSEGALQTSRSFAGLVFRNEFYDLQVGSPWIYDAPKFGVPFGARHISIVVELPDDFPVVPDAYRQFLRYASGEQAEVKFEHFARDTSGCRPQWLKDMVDELARSARPAALLENDLSAFRKHLGVRLYLHVEHAEDGMPGAEALRNWGSPNSISCNSKTNRMSGTAGWRGAPAAFIRSRGSCSSTAAIKRYPRWPKSCGALPH